MFISEADCFVAHHKIVLAKYYLWVPTYLSHKETIQDGSKPSENH